MALNLRKPYNYPPDSAPRKYADKLVSVEEKMKRVERKIKEHAKAFLTEPLNWGYVGDMAYVSDQLDEILEHFGE